VTKRDMLSRPGYEWGDDEFQYNVEMTLDALKPGRPKPAMKGLTKEQRVGKAEWRKMRGLGAFFPPEDRYYLLPELPNLDILNEDVPVSAVTVSQHRSHKKGYIGNGAECRIQGVFRHSKLTQNHKGPAGIPLQFADVYRWADGTLKGVCDWFILDPISGNIYDTKHRVNRGFNDKHFEAAQLADHGKALDGELDAPHHVHLVLQIANDRQYMWNVQAEDEDGSKVQFGVYGPQIQSLFYARDLPTTETGRKRPILHWCSAHQRRLRNGITLDVAEHLRGTTDFNMNGTNFKITNPTKGEQ